MLCTLIKILQVLQKIYFKKFTERIIRALPDTILDQ